MTLTFSNPIIVWKGPAPYFYVAVPPEDSTSIREVARQVTYGWGVIPVTVRLGDTTWTTSLFPRDGIYLVPLKAAIRSAENVAEGDVVTLTMTLGAS